VEAIRGIKLVEDGKPRLTLSEFKAMVREQYFMLLLDEDTALAAIPSLLPPNADMRKLAFAALRQVVSARDEIVGEVAERMRRIARLFALDTGATTVAPLPGVGDPEISKAS